MNIMSATSNEYQFLVDRICALAVEEFRQSRGNSLSEREAACRYFKRGTTAGLTTAELVDFLGVSSPSVLDKANYSDAETQRILKIIGEITDEEISSMPL